MDTLELCGDIMQPGGQLETPGLVLKGFISTYIHFIPHSRIDDSDQNRNLVNGQAWPEPTNK